MIGIRSSKIYAFTLIELMIVIAIIGILAGVMVPNFMKSRAEAQLSGCEQNLQTIATAANMYLVRNKVTKRDSGKSIACDVGIDIGKIDGLVAESHEHGEKCLHMDDLVDAGCLKSAPICPSTGTCTYQVECGHNSNFTVYCSGTNHSACDLAADFPKYSATSGLLEK